MKYFSFFPKVNYDVDQNGNQKNVTNITTRFRIKRFVEDNLFTYYFYQISDGERIDTIADFYYGDPTLSWLVLLSNDIFDAVWEMPLKQEDLNDYIISKYGSFANSLNIKHYEQSGILNSNNEFIEYPKPIIITQEDYAQISGLTYGNNNTPIARPVTFFDYEFELNETKRQIKLIDRIHLPDILRMIEEVTDGE